MAKFKYKWGTMNSGKSQELLRTHYNYTSRGETPLAFTSSLDNRTGIGIIETRAGENINAIPISNLNEIKEYIEELEKQGYERMKEIPCVLIDEVQFLSEDVILFIKNKFIIEYNIPVIAYGLKTDFQNKLFEGSKACLIYAEEITEIETICRFCRKKATMNLRLKDGMPTYNGEQVDISYDYFPVCHLHYYYPDFSNF